MKKKQKQHYTGKKWIAALVVIVLIFAAIYYYIALPAINIHNPELWKFVLFILVIAFALYADVYKRQEHGLITPHLYHQFNIFM